MFIQCRNVNGTYFHYNNIVGNVNLIWKLASACFDGYTFGKITLVQHSRERLNTVTNVRPRGINTQIHVLVHM